MLQTLLSCKHITVTDCCFDLGLLSGDNVVKFCFTIDNSKKIIVKLIPLKAEGLILVKVLAKFTGSDIISIKITEPKTSETLDCFITRVFTQIYYELVPRLVGSSKLSEFESFGIKGQFADVYGCPTGKYADNIGMKSGLQGQYGPIVGERDLETDMMGMKFRSAPYESSWSKPYGTSAEYMEPNVKRSYGNVGSRQF